MDLENKGVAMKADETNNNNTPPVVDATVSAEAAKERKIQTLMNKINQEAKRIEADAISAANENLKSARWLRWMHYFIGVPMTLSATWATYMQSIHSTSELAMLLAMITATLGGLQTFLQPTQKAHFHERLASSCIALRNDTRTFREIELPQQDLEHATKAIRDLDSRRNAMMEAVLSTSTPSGPEEGESSGS